MSVELKNKKCVPCEGGVPPLTPGEIEKYQKELKTSWEVVENKKIKKEFVFKNFKQAMAFVNEVADLAEFEGHHPDIYIFWNKVTLELSTHAIKGLSENDFIMAAKIDSVEVL